MQATVDRIEGGVAVLITREETPARITIPARLLPEGSREGDIVTVALGADTGATENARDAVSRTIGRLVDK
jgi:hypothetical protein